ASSDHSRQGYIRSDAIRSGTAFPQLDLYQAAGGSRPYSELQHSLDEAETRIHQAELLISEISERFDSLKAAKAAALPNKHLRSGRLQPMGASPDGSAAPVSIGAFPAVYLNATDYAAGGAVTWRPAWLSWFELELDGGAVFVGGSSNVIFADAGVIWPTGWQFGWFSPYLAAAGGVLRREAAVQSGKSNQLNPVVNAGGGVQAEISGRFYLRADARAVVEFTDADRTTDGRISLGLFRSF
ncbi:MAG TPA: hypothetical protein VJ417_12585, partial [Candidatus Glassbacteria bacterium]|nr:hypothetical protein [Candidatus Glassbacteria bacterium]